MRVDRLRLIDIVHAKDQKLLLAFRAGRPPGEISRLFLDPDRQQIAKLRRPVLEPILFGLASKLVGVPSGLNAQEMDPFRFGDCRRRRGTGVDNPIVDRRDCAASRSTRNWRDGNGCDRRSACYGYSGDYTAIERP